MTLSPIHFIDRRRLRISGGESFHSSRHRRSKLFTYHQTRRGKKRQNRRFRDGARHLPERLLPEGRQSHAADKMDAARGVFGRRVYFQNGCLVVRHPALGSVFFRLRTLPGTV